MKQWIIYLLGLESPASSLSVGSRVNTPFGKGTVLGGAITVRVDHPFRSPTNGALNTGFTVNLDKITTEK